MPSIFGQAMETGASGGYGAGGPSVSGIGTFLSSLFGGGGGGGGGVPTPPTDTAFSAGGPSSSGIPSAGVGYADPSAGTSTGGLFPSATPGDVMSPSGIAGASYSPVTPNTPESVMNPGNVGGTAAAPYSSAAGDPSGGPDPTLWQEIKNFFEGGGGPGAQTAPGSAGAGGKGMGLGGWIGLGGGMLEMLNRYLVQRTLQDPAKLAAAANKLARPLGAQARERLIAPARAAAQETSGINAPLLYSQAIASVLAPYQYQAEQNALREEIAALTASEGGAFGGPSMFGGSGSATG